MMSDFVPFRIDYVSNENLGWPVIATQDEGNASYYREFAYFLNMQPNSAEYLQLNINDEPFGSDTATITRKYQEAEMIQAVAVTPVVYEDDNVLAMQYQLRTGFYST